MSVKRGMSVKPVIDFLLVEPPFIAVKKSCDVMITAEEPAL
jgi:hypothetical protein